MPFKTLLVAALLVAGTPASARSVPDISVVVLPFGRGDGGTATRNKELLRGTWQLLVTMHDMGLLRLQLPTDNGEMFSSCFLPKQILGEASNGPNTIQCVGDRLKTDKAPSVPIALIVEDTRKRSSAQDFTCIGPGGRGVGRNPIHLADLFHIYPFVRKSHRDKLMQCIEGALGTRR